MRLMRKVDPLMPGRRLRVAGGAARRSTELADTFNAMLDRLEAERRESMRRAIGAQEAERLRIAQELHDEVGQTLTAVLLQLASAMPRARRTPTSRRRARTSARTSTTCAASPATCGPTGARRARPAQRAVALAPGCSARPASRSSARLDSHLPAADARGGARDLPRRAGGADERRPPRRRRAQSSSRSSAAPTRLTLRVADDGRGVPATCGREAAASAACTSARCSIHADLTRRPPRRRRHATSILHVPGRDDGLRYR